MKKCEYSKFIVDYAYRAENDIAREFSEHLKNCEYCQLLWKFHKKLQIENQNILINQSSDDLKERIKLAINRRNTSNLDFAYIMINRHIKIIASIVILLLALSVVINIMNFSKLYEAKNIDNSINFVDTSDLNEQHKKIINSEITKDLLLEIAFSNE
ncbi:MAG TPA: hypothetical protein PLM75_04295 [bacterium]|nr:hypothetical protein [bacterium]